jgi:ABC-type molybdate transport system substrate-binding protein
LFGGCAGQARDEDSAWLRHTGTKILTISAAASMQKVLEDIRVLYNQKYPQAKITFNFGSSGSLQHQIDN